MRDERQPKALTSILLPAAHRRSTCSTHGPAKVCSSSLASMKKDWRSGCLQGTVDRYAIRRVRNMKDSSTGIRRRPADVDDQTHPPKGAAMLPAPYPTTREPMPTNVSYTDDQEPEGAPMKFRSRLPIMVILAFAGLGAKETIADPGSQVTNSIVRSVVENVRDNVQRRIKDFERERPRAATNIRPAHRNLWQGGAARRAYARQQFEPPSYTIGSNRSALRR